MDLWRHEYRIYQRLTLSRTVHVVVWTVYTRNWRDCSEATSVIPEIFGSPVLIVISKALQSKALLNNIF